MTPIYISLFPRIPFPLLLCWQNWFKEKQDPTPPPPPRLTQILACHSNMGLNGKQHLGHGNSMGWQTLETACGCWTKQRVGGESRLCQGSIGDKQGEERSSIQEKKRAFLSHQKLTPGSPTSCRLVSLTRTVGEGVPTYGGSDCECLFVLSGLEDCQKQTCTLPSLPVGTPPAAGLAASVNQLCLFALLI